MKQKPALKPIQSLFKKNALDLILFGFVQGAKKYIPSASIIDLVDGFSEEYNLNEDEYPSESAMTTYNRMLNDFINLKRNHD
jgi:hypothetical protein